MMLPARAAAVTAAIGMPYARLGTIYLRASYLHRLELWVPLQALSPKPGPGSGTQPRNHARSGDGSVLERRQPTFAGIPLLPYLLLDRQAGFSR